MGLHFFSDFLSDFFSVFFSDFFSDFFFDFVSDCLPGARKNGMEIAVNSAGGGSTPPAEVKKNIQGALNQFVFFFTKITVMC